MIIVHHLEQSRSTRVLWLLEELGLNYELKVYKRDPKTKLAGPDLKAVHPLGKSPVVEVDGKKLAESGAILEYIVEMNGGRLGVAVGDPRRFDYLYWMHYAEGTAMTAMLVQLYVSRSATERQWLLDQVAGNVRAQAGWMEQGLAGRDWFAGDFSAADIQMSYPAEFAVAAPGAAKHLPKLAGFVERIKARPAYQRALEKGGPVMW